MAEEYRFFTVRLTSEEYQQFEELAARSFRSKADLFRKWLAEAVQEARQPLAIGDSTSATAG